MARASGVGSWPGDDMGRALDEIASVLGCVPFLPELPQRDASSGMVARSLALLAGGPARDRLEVDVAAWAPYAAGGTAVVAFAGPATLAACGALDPTRPDLAAGLGAAIAAFAREAAVATGGTVTAQVDEPCLGTASRPEVDALRTCLDAVRRGGGDPLVHSCAQPVPRERLAALGVACSVDCTTLSRLPKGWRAGIVPTSGPVDVEALARHATRIVAPEDRDELVVTPTCGLGLSKDAVARLRLTVAVARRIDARPA